MMSSGFCLRNQTPFSPSQGRNPYEQLPSLFHESLPLSWIILLPAYRKASVAIAPTLKRLLLTSCCPLAIIPISLLPFTLCWSWFPPHYFPFCLEPILAISDGNCFVKAIRTVLDAKSNGLSSVFMLLHLSALFGRADLWKSIVSWLLHHHSLGFCLLSSHYFSVSSSSPSPLLFSKCSSIHVLGLWPSSSIIELMWSHGLTFHLLAFSFQICVSSPISPMSFTLAV